eukprot:scaffold168071_cov17-Tisochrysis_lutea.AAC.1
MQRMQWQDVQPWDTCASYQLVQISDTTQVDTLKIICLFGAEAVRDAAQALVNTVQVSQPALLVLLACGGICRWATQEPGVMGASYDGVLWDPPADEAYQW